MTPVGPSEIRRWIRDTHQRRIDLLKVRKILDHVDVGTWDHQSQTAMVVRNGVLLDGHHRALAILMNGDPININLEIRGEQ